VICATDPGCATTISGYAVAVTIAHDGKPADRIAELERRIAQLEHDRDRAATELGHARDALRVRDEIFAVVAHDLRNPLGTIVMGATALVQLGGGGGSDAAAARIRTVAERIERQAQRMTRQIGNLTDFTEAQGGRLTIHREPHAPQAILAMVSEQLAPTARERSITLDARAADGLPDVACDAERIVQALISLCANAIKVTANGGSIEIGARAGEAGRPEFFVRDHGPGIDREDAMFEPWWRSEQPGYRGAALGFSIARGIVDAHGGRIWLETAAGTGATVRFSLATGD
jgi:signal transduction histidine kinase